MKGQAFQQMCHKALCERLAMTTRIENAERQINIDCYEIEVNLIQVETARAHFKNVFSS